VELALCLPFICLLLLGVVQTGVVVRDHVMVVAAAREGARAAAVSASPSMAAAGAVSSRGLAGVEVSTAVHGSLVTVTVRYVDHTDVPLIGALVPDAAVEASVTMALEPP